MDDLLVPAVIMRLMFPAIVRARDLPAAARPRPARRRLRRRHDAGDRVHPAVHGRRHALGSRRASTSGRCAGSASGCCCAAATGAGAWLFGHPFLTSHVAHVDAAAARRAAPAERASLFDIGVFALVVGATVLMLIALAHQSLRDRHRATCADEDHDGSSSSPSPSACCRLRRLAAAAAAHLPGHHRLVAAVLRGEPVHLRDGPAARSARRRSGGRRRRPIRRRSPTRCRRRWC